MRFTLAIAGRLCLPAFLWLALALPAQAAPDAQCRALEQKLAAAGPASTARYAGHTGTGRYDEAIRRQREARDRTHAHVRRLGCGRREPMFFQKPDPEQCRDLTGTLAAMEKNLAQLEGARARIARYGAGNDAGRGQILRTMRRLGCAATDGEGATDGDKPNNFHIQEIGGPARGSYKASWLAGRRALGSAPSYRTLCVRSCDGFYFPVSFATLPKRFAQDAKTCEAHCPTADVGLYVHQNPGGDVDGMMSLNGKPYSDLANAWRFRKEYVKGCTCNAVTLALDGAEDGEAASTGLTSVRDRAARETATR